LNYCYKQEKPVEETLSSTGLISSTYLLAQRFIVPLTFGQM